MSNNRLPPFSLTIWQLTSKLGYDLNGLSNLEAGKRLQQIGPNRLPEPQPVSILSIFSHQFRSPLIYILLLAATVSLLMQDWTDAGFIFAVLLLNAVIGGYQEYSAQRSARALRSLVTPQAEVLRDGEIIELDAAQLVPGDIVLVETGRRIPADLRLIDTHNLSIDESLLTGESLPVEKIATAILDINTTLGDRVNMAFAGSIVTQGRGGGLVISTGTETELGKIASSVLAQSVVKAPLLVRMELFTQRIAIAIGIVAMMLLAVSVIRGMPLDQVFVLVVALSVSAIPEGLPVAITVALAVAMSRMAKRNVIVRQLVAIEALGSCTCIASDKTGTLTVNQLTVKQLVLPDSTLLDVTGEGIDPHGHVGFVDSSQSTLPKEQLDRLARAALLANEGVLAKRNHTWIGRGDAADLAMLVMAYKLGVTQSEFLESAPQLDSIPYESEHRYAASLNQVGGRLLVSVKGAFETILEMCDKMAVAGGDVAIDVDPIKAQALALSKKGYRVLAIADGYIEGKLHAQLTDQHLRQLTLLGLVGMVDPPRKEAAAAIKSCHRSGIRVIMVTGDHPATAYSIAQSLGLIERPDQVVTGGELNSALLDGQQVFDALCARSLVFSRVEARQKLEIVESLQRSGHFVAVTGDGVNDAPALRAAHVGIAMGKGGTDVARETAGLILTDDNFSSIVAGIEEGRVAYNNIRKVIFLLISTGAAELVLFLFTLIAGLPFPLFAVQLLWLNLVTNGIQDVALAFEPAEGHELSRRPRHPKESIFNRIMIERVMISALLIGSIAFMTYNWLLSRGVDQDVASNAILLLMVLFENIQAFNSRSESISIFKHNLLRNRLLFFGTLAAQLIHIAAMYTPGLSGILHLQPVSFVMWLALLGMSLTLLAAVEVHKWYRNQKPL